MEQVFESSTREIVTIFLTGFIVGCLLFMWENLYNTRKARYKTFETSLKYMYPDFYHVLGKHKFREVYIKEAIKIYKTPEKWQWVLLQKRKYPLQLPNLCMRHEGRCEGPYWESLRLDWNANGEKLMHDRDVYENRPNSTHNIGHRYIP